MNTGLQTFNQPTAQTNNIIENQGYEYPSEHEYINQNQSKGEEEEGKKYTFEAENKLVNKNFKDK